MADILQAAQEKCARSIGGWLFTVAVFLAILATVWTASLFLHSLEILVAMTLPILHLEITA